MIPAQYALLFLNLQSVRVVCAEHGCNHYVHIALKKLIFDNDSLWTSRYGCIL